MGGGGGGCLTRQIRFWTPPPLRIFHFLLYRWEFPRQSKAQPLDIPQNCVSPWKFPRPKTKSTRNSTLFFLGHPLGNSTCYFFDTPGNSISSLTLPSCFFFFFWNSPMLLCLVKTQCIFALSTLLTNEGGGIPSPLNLDDVP